MANILNIETSTDYCSVSLSQDGECKLLKIERADSSQKSVHSELLCLFIKEIINEANIAISDLDAVALSGGPGSYTGLRIATSTCKGLCFGAKLPLIAINTLQIIASMAKSKINSNYDFIMPMIDARRMEVYTSLINSNLELISPVSAEVVDENSFQEIADKKIILCGNGAAKCMQVINNSNFSFIDGVFPSAEFMCLLSERAFTEKNFVDLAYYEPFYLKEFVATTSKKALF